MGKSTWFIWECWSTWFYFLSRKGNQLVFLALRLIMVLSSFKLNQQQSFQRRCWNEFVCKCLKQPLRGNFLIWKQFTNNYISNAFEKPFKKPYNCIMGLVESLPLLQTWVTHFGWISILLRKWQWALICEIILKK